MEENAPESLSKRCAKCLAPMSHPDWVVNKDMAYCAECAALLHLGESKESRMFNDMKDKEPGSLPAGLAPVDPATEELQVPIPGDDEVADLLS
jgi:hypothetical protein